VSSSVVVFVTATLRVSMPFLMKYYVQVLANRAEASWGIDTKKRRILGDV
jgi:hypothetical protein